RKTAPTHFAREAKLVQKLWLVLCNSSRQNVGLPCRGGEFGALQLFDNLQRAVHAVKLAAGGEMLPSIEEREELGSSDRFDFAAQASDGQPMNARKQPAVAPLDFARAIRPCCKLAPQNLSFGFELGECLVDH